MWKVLVVTVATVLGMLVSVPPTTAAGQPCRVRNVTQETSGRSLISMAEEASDGDRLHVRGTCPGVVIIDTDIDITGVGDTPTLTGRQRTRVVRVEQGAEVTLRDLLITRGAGVPNGAGIANDGNLTLLDVTVERNKALARLEGFIWGWGGGIENTGRLLLEDSTVRRNKAQRSAGGISNIYGSVVLRRSVVSGNATIEPQYDPYGGGGIENSIKGHLRLVDSTVTNNWAGDYGGGIYNSNWNAKATIIRSTIDGNSATWGGGIYNLGVLTLDSSSVSNNDADEQGGGIGNGRKATLTDSVVAGNTNTGWGGGGIHNSGTLRLVGTSVMGNTTASWGGGLRTEGGTVTLDEGSQVRGNARVRREHLYVADDCVGTPLC